MIPLNESSPKSEATASKLLSTGDTLERLDGLRQTVRDLDGRAAQSERDFATRSARLRAQFEQSVESVRADLATQVEAEASAAAAQRQHAEFFFEARKKRIARASQSARQRRLGDIESEEGRRTFEIQRDLLQADRTRETDTQNVKTAFENFSARLAQEQFALQQTEACARSTLGAYRAFVRLLSTPPAGAPPDLSAHEDQVLEQLHAALDKTDRELARCRHRVLPLVFRFVPVWLWVPVILLVPFAFVPAWRRLDFQAVPTHVWEILAACLAGVVVLRFLGRRSAAPAARSAALALDQARLLYDACAAKAQASYAQEMERIQLVHTSTTKKLNEFWQQTQADAQSLRNDWTRWLDDQTQRVSAENEERHRHRLARIETEHEERVARLNEDSASRSKQLDATRSANLNALNAAHESSRMAIEAEWTAGVLPLCETLQGAGAVAAKLFPPWQPELWERFTLPNSFPHAARFGELVVDLEALCGVRIQDKALAFPGSTRLAPPLLLSVPRQASILFETKQSGREQAISVLDNLVLRLLTVTPPGRLSFTIFDPVGLGQNFAGVMHLADFEERLITSRIWTQTAQIEQRLADLSEHIEKVTQMYLRNEYETLAEYNAQAGRLAEKYHFLVIVDFPANFSDVALKRLLSIANSGPRCGVHTFIHWDQRRPAPVEFVPEELRKHSICIVAKGDGFALAQAEWPGIKLALDGPPDPGLATRLLQQIGRASVDSYRVEMPFAEVAPADGELWTVETTHELRVPIGRTGATKLQYLALGEGTRQHGLIAGKTGSGKSTLFHVIITNLALWCSPEQVEFYLVDFKKGVEFKCYASRSLPHARVVAIESDREFGLSVLQRVDEELKRRGDLFRQAGVQDLAGYKKAGGNEPMPRTLLIIDEFQEFFVEDDRISQSAALLLDRIVRQGRAFGIHVLLGSQTLGGAYTLARATIGQMVVRVALQCNEADAYLIMNEDNPAPRLLSRPGEAIYNDDGGAIQGNSPFQVVWLPDQVRQTWLEKISTFAERSEVERPEPIVFEGNAPANVRENAVLRALLEARAIQPTSAPRIWLGAPNSIKGPTEVVLRRQSGNNLLIVGQREEAALGLLAIALVSLAAQHRKDSARFFLFDCSAPDSAEARFLERVVRAVPHGVTLVNGAELPEIITELATEMERRTEQPAAAIAPANYLLVHALEKHKKLRYDEELSFSMDAAASAGNPGLLFNKLICEGAPQGFHVLSTCDTYNNVMRCLSRKALSEFEMRVVFQMSANDSASLIDTPQANHLGLHRAIYFNGHGGWLETFRPYALPGDAWLDNAALKLARLHDSVRPRLAPAS